METLLKWLSPVLAALGFATLWGRHTRGMEAQQKELTDFKKSQDDQRKEDQGRANKEHDAMWRRIENTDSQMADALKEVYARLHADDIRRDEREDKLREDMNKIIERFDDKVGEQNELYRELINYLK